MIETKVTFLEGFYPANQNNLKSFQKALIGWKKAGPLKINQFCFDHVNRLNLQLLLSVTAATEIFVTDFIFKSNDFILFCSIIILT